MSETAWTQGPWEYIPGTEHHGPYVSGPYGGDICDCYAMSNPESLSVRNGGKSQPIWHQAERADANARLIAAAPTMYALLSQCRDAFASLDEGDLGWGEPGDGSRYPIRDGFLASIDAALAKVSQQQGTPQAPVAPDSEATSK